MLTTEQRISVVSWRLNGLPFAEVQERFRRRYRTEAPTRTTIRGLVNKFQRTGNVCDEKRSGRPSTSQETVETIRQAIEQSPKASTRRLSREHGIPKSTVWQTLRFVLKKKAYHIQVLHHLEPEDYAARMAMCHDLIEAVNNEHLLAHVLFSDEATFHTCGLVNRHNSRIWADEQPHIAMELERNTPKVNVWLDLTQQRIYGPFFFAEATITSTSYLDMLEQFLQPQLFADNILDSVVFQQDGAPPHIVRNYLNETFPGRWIGRGSPRFWAARSPDLTPLDFFAWGHIKSQVYEVKIRDLQHLRERISAAVRTITPAMLQRVFRCTEERWQLCLDMEGNHVERQ